MIAIAIAITMMMMMMNLNIYIHIYIYIYIYIYTYIHMSKAEPPAVDRLHVRDGVEHALVLLGGEYHFVCLCFLSTLSVFFRFVQK